MATDAPPAEAVPVAAPVQDDKPVDTEKTLSDFYRNDVLSDITLLNPTTKQETRAHKAILASGSKYFLEVFRTSAVDVLKSVEIPQPLKTSSNQQGAHNDEIF